MKFSKVHLENIVVVFLAVGDSLLLSLPYKIILNMNNVFCLTLVSSFMYFVLNLSVMAAGGVFCSNTYNVSNCF